MRVYVAGAYSERGRVVHAYNLVTTSGLTLAHDWVSVIDSVQRLDHELSALERRMYANEDLRFLRAADAVWFLVPAPGHGAGSWVELGVAIDMRYQGPRPLIVASGAYSTRSIFTELADTVFVDDSEALEWLVQRAERTKEPRC